MEVKQRYELDAIGRACSVYHVENNRSVSTLIHESPHVYIDRTIVGDREGYRFGGDCQPKGVTGGDREEEIRQFKHIRKTYLYLLYVWRKLYKGAHNSL